MHEVRNLRAVSGLLLFTLSRQICFDVEVAFMNETHTHTSKNMLTLMAELFMMDV